MGNFMISDCACLPDREGLRISDCGVQNELLRFETLSFELSPRFYSESLIRTPVLLPR